METGGWGLCTIVGGADYVVWGGGGDYVVGGGGGDYVVWGGGGDYVVGGGGGNYVVGGGDYVVGCWGFSIFMRLSFFRLEHEMVQKVMWQTLQAIHYCHSHGVRMTHLYAHLTQQYSCVVATCILFGESPCIDRHVTSVAQFGFSGILIRISHSFMCGCTSSISHCNAE